MTDIIFIPIFSGYYHQIRIETDPADRTQLRMTVASGDPTLTFEYAYLTFKFIAPHYHLRLSGD